MRITLLLVIVVILSISSCQHRYWFRNTTRVDGQKSGYTKAIKSDARIDLTPIISLTTIKAPIFNENKLNFNSEKHKSNALKSKGVKTTIVKSNVTAIGKPLTAKPADKRFVFWKTAASIVIIILGFSLALSGISLGFYLIPIGMFLTFYVLKRNDQVFADVLLKALLASIFAFLILGIVFLFLIGYIGLGIFAALALFWICYGIVRFKKLRDAEEGKLEAFFEWLVVALLICLALFIYIFISSAIQNNI